MADSDSSTMEIRQIEHTTTITLCCEVEPDWRLSGEQSCPDCGQWDPETVDRVTIEHEVADDE